MTTTVTERVQNLEPGAIWEGFQIDLTMFSAGFLYLHNYPQAGSIWWQGNEYVPRYIVAEGFAKTGDQQPIPRITVGNTDGAITALCLAFQDILGAVVTRHRTYVEYLDAVNYPGGVNPDADSDEEFPIEAWFIDRRSGDDGTIVQFELSSPLDYLGKQLPGRQIIANHCPWDYRSTECGYVGGAVATINDVATSDITQDNCSRKVSGCKFRFVKLAFGGFPAAGLTRT